jgi:purine-binding chemotaxis protein CheW
MEMTRRKLLSGARFLSFTLDEEGYCIEILKIKELIGLTRITPLPRTPEYIRGVINLRGQIVPVLDLRLKFGFPFREYGKRTSVIVVEAEFRGEPMQMGLIVDSIQEVLSIPEDKISRMPYINARVRADYIKGVANVDDGMRVMLDVARIIDDDDLESLAAMADGSAGTAGKED